MFFCLPYNISCYVGHTLSFQDTLYERLQKRVRTALLYGMVIDNKALNTLLIKLYSAITAVASFVLASSTFGTAGMHGTGACQGLTPEQVGALVAKLSTTGGDGNCSMANLTIGEVLSM